MKSDQKSGHRNRFYSALLSQGGTTGLLHGGEGSIPERKALTVYQRGFNSGASLRATDMQRRERSYRADLFLAAIKIKKLLSN